MKTDADSLCKAETPTSIASLKGGAGIGRPARCAKSRGAAFRLSQFRENHVSSKNSNKSPAKYNMAFFSSAVTTLQTIVIAIGAALGIWGLVNLMEGYGSDNPGAKSQGVKQLVAGAGIALIGATLVPLLSSVLG